MKEQEIAFVHLLGLVDAGEENQSAPSSRGMNQMLEEAAENVHSQIIKREDMIPSENTTQKSCIEAEARAASQHGKPKLDTLFAVYVD